MQKSQTKKVVSLAGVYVARRFVSHCTGCGRVFQDPALRRWVAHGWRTAWDVLVFVGRRLFQDCHTVGQIHAELLGRDVPVSASQIARLGQKFILYLALAHRRATPCIKRAMALSGGYILHLDGLHQNVAWREIRSCCDRLCAVFVVFAGQKSGDGYGFPFDRPLLAVAERILDLVDYLPDLLQILPSDDPAGKRLLLKLSRKVLNVTAESDFQKAVEELRWRSKLFDRLRRCMRIAEPGGRDGLNDDGSKTSMNSIRKGVKKFRRQLDTNQKRKHDPLCGKMAQQIDKYAGKLFADPIQVKTPT